jgi:formylglycine-generating enzyme required for sulfatase activity
MGDASGRPDEQPPHAVYIDEFRMGLTPVTNAEFGVFLQATGHEAPRFWDDARFNAPSKPVVGVSWFDAVAFCAWLSDRTGEPWRLPTEAEREKASRGGRSGERYPWGDDPGAGGGQFAQDAPWDVGRSRPDGFGANGYGLFDTGYNVHEWCSDWYGSTYYAASPTRNPQGPADGVRRASRGGAWRHQVKICRNAARSSLDPEFRYNDYGFRVVNAPIYEEA